MAKRVQVEYEKEKGKYIDDITFYLINARGCTTKEAEELIDDNEALIDNWFRNARSPRSLEPPVNAVVAARILVSKVRYNYWR